MQTPINTQPTAHLVQVAKDVSSPTGALAMSNDGAPDSATFADGGFSAVFTDATEPATADVASADEALDARHESAIAALPSESNPAAATLGAMQELPLADQDLPSAGAGTASAQQVTAHVDEQIAFALNSAPRRLLSGLASHGDGAVRGSAEPAAPGRDDMNAAGARGELAPAAMNPPVAEAVRLAADGASRASSAPAAPIATTLRTGTSRTAAASETAPAASARDAAAIAINVDTRALESAAAERQLAARAEMSSATGTAAPASHNTVTTAATPLDAASHGAALPAAPTAPLLGDSAGTSASVPQFTLQPPIDSARWSAALGQRLAMLARTGDQRAELILNPPNLGKLTVQLSLDNDNATVQFVTPHAAVRDALESAVPKLRELMAEGGLQLVDVDVSHEEASTQQFAQQDGDARGDANATPATSDDADDVQAAGSSISGVRLVDAYV